jgi:hypothetical protein
MTTETDRPSIEDVIADMNDDALAETAQDIREEGQRLLRMAGLAEHELVQRMKGRGATVLDTDHWEGALTPGAPSHQIDDERMLALQELLSEEDWATVHTQPAPPAPRWDKRVLNELAKRGGDIRTTIEGATVSTRGEPRLKLKRKS